MAKTRYYYLDEEITEKQYKELLAEFRDEGIDYYRDVEEESDDCYRDDEEENDDEYL